MTSRKRSYVVPATTPPKAAWLPSLIGCALFTAIPTAVALGVEILSH